MIISENGMNANICSNTVVENNIFAPYIPMAKARGFTAHLVIGNADTLNSKAPACRVMIGGQELYYYGAKTGTPNPAK